MSRFSRRRTEAQGSAAPLELFFDLVFVFAITQVSHLLLSDLTWEGAGRAAITLLVVWWSWNYTTWVTNELDTDAVIVRLLVIVVMLASLVMAIAIPEAFEDRALLFVCAYVVIQVGRHFFLTFVAAESGTIERRRAGQILTWFCGAGVFWIAGGFADGTARYVLWGIALVIDYGAPVARFRVPGLARLANDAWQVQTAHFAERFQLFIIIVLGETIVITGATTSELPIDTPRVVAFGLAFVSTAAMWWLYFDSVARVAEDRLEAAADRTAMARDAYTYLHVLMAAGVIAAAVGDELVIAHPTDHLHTPEVVVLVAGPAIYLAAHALFQLRITGRAGWPRLAGAAACVIAGFLGTSVPALVIGGVVALVLILVIAVEVLAGRHALAGQLATD